MKKTLTGLVLLLILIIPTVIAVANYRYVKNAPADEKNVVRVTIDNLREEHLIYEKKKDGDSVHEMIKFFLGINSRAEKIVALPDEVLGNAPYVVTMETNVKAESYRYYFSLDPKLCYFIGPDNSSYQIAEADAAAFLESGYAESMYEYSAFPTLTLSGKYEVAPSTAVWKYMNYKGEYTDEDTSVFTAQDKKTYDNVTGFALSFDNAPDYFYVKITDSDGNVLFDDLKEKLLSLPVETDTDVNVEVTAKWFEDEDRQYYGEALYQFDAAISPAPSFYISHTETMPGYFISISAKNVADPELIEFSSAPDIGFTPVFYNDGEYARALLALDTSLKPGNYELTFKCAGTEQKTNLVLKERPFADAYITVSGDVISKSRTEAAQSEFEQLVAQLTASGSDTRYWEGHFLTGAGSSCELVRGFGRRIIINNDTANTYVNNGIDYGSGSASDVTAVNNGMVVYTGTLAYTGNIVVIEHGYGLKTWYWNLGSVDVKEGVTVSRGDRIGTCGNTGFTDRTGVHFAMSVGNKFVCPYGTWEDGDGGIPLMGVE